MTGSLVSTGRFLLPSEKMARLEKFGHELYPQYQNMNEYEDDDQVHLAGGLIPQDHNEALSRLGAIVNEGIKESSNEVFVKGWWALCWLNPGLHPDDYEDWKFESWKDIAEEAFSRFERGELEDDELYPARASHNRLWKEMKSESAITE